MSNDDLVELVRNEPVYQEYHSPEFDRVLDIMMKVDRKDFLSGQLIAGVIMGLDEFERMYRALRESTTADRKKLDRLVNFVTELVPSVSKRKVANLIASVQEVANSAKPATYQIVDLAYEDTPLPIGHGQTCSQPSMVAFMAYSLELEEGMRVFELGYGCGYSASIASHLIGDSGYLVAAEIIPELVALGQGNLETHLSKLGLHRRTNLIPGNGLKELENEAPFDRIYLTAGVNLESFDPSKLAIHLNPNGGILLFPEKRGDLIKQVYKNGNLIDTKRYGDGNLRFVPLIEQTT